MRKGRPMDPDRFQMREIKRRLTALEKERIRDLKRVQDLQKIVIDLQNKR